MKYSYAAWALVFLFFVYVLSIGPAVRFSVLKGPNSRTTKCVDFLYEPIFWLRDELSPIRKWTGWYIDFWVFYHTDSERNGD